MARHRNWTELRRMLSNEAISRGIASRSVLAHELGLSRRLVRDWLMHGVMPCKAHLEWLAAVTGNAKYRDLRS